MGIVLACFGAQPLAAQSIESPTAACTEVNTGVFDIATGGGVSVVSGSISGDFTAGEILTFSVATEDAGEVIDSSIVDDITSSVSIVNSTEETSVEYAIPSDGEREFSLFLDRDESEASISVSCTSAPQGSITITKDYGEDSGTFEFSGDLGVFSFSINGASASQSFSSLSPGSYTVTETLSDTFSLEDISCTGDDDGGSVVDISAGSVAIDLDDGESITCTFRNASVDDDTDVDSDDPADDETDEDIINFLYNRAGALLSSNPDRTSIVRKSDGMLAPNGVQKMNARADSDGAEIEFSAKRSIGGVKNIDLWVEGHYTRYKFENGPNYEGDIGIVYVGADFLPSENLMIGVLGQFDWADETSEPLGRAIDGFGWMVGPYLSARLSENLFFDARAASGKSSNELLTEETGLTDEFKTNRRMVKSALTGNKRFGNWRVTPSASIAYIEEKLEGFVSASGNTIGEQSVALGRVTFEPELAYRRELSSGLIIEPQISLAGLWDFETPDNLSVADWMIGVDKFRLRASSGFQIMWPNGYAIRASAFYDGIGADQFESYGARMWINIPIATSARSKRGVVAPMLTPETITEPEIIPPLEPIGPDGAMIEFADKKAVLSGSAYTSLVELWSKAAGGDIKEIIVFASEANIELGIRRSNAIKQALAELGAPQHLIYVDIGSAPANEVSITIAYE